MAFHGTKGTFRFEVSEYIPEVANLISGDSRYTRAFTKNEGIIIRAPLGSGLFTNQDGIYSNFALPYNELVNWSSADQGIANLPSEITGREHNPTSWFTNIFNTSQMPDHMFAGESDGFLTITRSDNGYSFVAGLVTSPESAIKYSASTSTFRRELVVPYLYGSIIEGVTSGARRFIVGPIFTSVSNPSYSQEYALGDYGKLAVSGTGPYGANTLRFIMPQFGGTGDESRYDLFQYISESSVRTSNPINPNFFKSSPFDTSRIDYSGFRIRDRKGIPVPYNIPDKETIDSFINGPSVEPEITIFGTSGNQETAEWWSVGSVTTDVTRRHAFAITKRHVLGFPYAQHAFAASSDNPSHPDFYGFERGLTGKTPFTDTAEYGAGDKILFWDKQNRVVIQRTIIDSKPIDVEAVREAVNSILAGAIPKLESSWECVEQYFEEYGVTGLACTAVSQGYGIDMVYHNYIATALDYEPVGGNVCTSFAPTVIPWKGYRIPANSEATSYADHISKVHEMRGGKRLVNKELFGDYLIDVTGGFDYLDNYSPYGGFGITSASNTGHFYPNPSLVYRNQYGSTGGARVLTSGAYNTVLPPNGIIQGDFLKSISTHDSILNEPFSNAAFSERLKGSLGVIGFNNSNISNPSDGLTTTASTGEEVIVPNEFGVIPPKDTDETVPSSSVDVQFRYLPTAARNAIKQYFPYGLNNVFYGSLSPNDEYRRVLTWQYILSHFRGWIGGRCTIHLLDEDLPDGVTPISFLDTRRSVLHKYAMVFDDQMRGAVISNCPERASFTPYWAFGDETQAADGWGGYAIGSRAVAHTNPYGVQTVTLELAKVGTCSSTYNETFLEDCEEPLGATSGPKCRWAVWSAAMGSGGDLLPSSNQVDIYEEDGCFSCWHEQQSNPLSTKLPTNIYHEDRLGSISKNYGMFLGGDNPTPIFTYNSEGVPIMSRIMVGSAYRSNISSYRYLFEYSVTGSNGDDFLKMNEYVFQNHDGSTGYEGSINGFAKMRVHRYSPDSGRLTLAMDFSDIMSGNLIYSNDHLLNCNANLFSNGGWLYNTDSECSSATKTFPHDLGKTAYIHNLGNSWIQAIRGGPRSMGRNAGFTLWTDGFIFGSASYTARNENCEYSPQDERSVVDIENQKVNFKNPIGTFNERLFATHSMGLALSDQKIYLRKANPTMSSPYQYFGTPQDLLIRMMNDLNTKNGISETYPLTKSTVVFSNENTDLVQPLASLVDVPVAEPKIIVNTSPGVYASEKQFLK